ncbi:uncharacterized protein si:dkey-229e3.2 [Astyanax mexicanus]|uniref:uncharacterized protein si:dkey-229e3.2 n=1 Tax=Astyanax mexicanus TaxID=7994 RepID=UPI0020CAE015|nr:uncharacterized protein si:dkey-229e3.2 [Astyanax mexicanus]
MMSECAVLENLSEDGFHSCEGFADWSSYSPVHWNGNQEDSSNSFGDWSTFNSNLSKDKEPASSESPPEEGRSGHTHKVEKSNKLRSSSVFYDCFHAEETIKDTAVMEIPPLSQLLLNSASTPPQPAALSSAAANLCQRLLCEPDCLSLSGPKPRLHSYKQLINTLHLTNSDPNIFQNTDFSDQDFEEQESSPAALIQTKLMVPTLCQNKPGYLYQISRQWLSQNSLNLLPH